MLLLLAALAVGVIAVVRRLRSGARAARLAASGETNVDKRHKGVQA
jgi:hypothetical protein